MRSRRSIAAWALGFCFAAAAFAEQPTASPEATTAQIVEKNAAARGGVEAWRKIETMAWTGHVESANAQGRNFSFLLEQKRPNNTRFEISTEGQKSVRVYDGSSGWKIRASMGGRPEIQPYSAEELRYARGAQVIDGPLMDYAAKGGLITLIGVDKVSNRKAHVLDVKLPVGGLHRVWVDAETFLELRHDREYRDASGRPAIATVFFGDYRPFEGLLLPVTIETGVVDGQAASKLVIERVALNPPLGDADFTKPAVSARRPGAAVVDTRAAAAASPPAPVAPR